jgi:SAM-dependent methyltransferase
LSFLQANAEDLSFLPASFDVVVCLEVVEHLRNPNGFLERVGEVLTKDGVLIVSTPNRTIINPGASLKDKPKNKFHLREYSREDFEALLKQFFDEVELFGLFNPQADRRGNPFVRRMKLLGNLVRLEKVVEVGPLRENKEPSDIVAVCKSKKE